MYKSNVNFNLYKIFYDVATYGSISNAAKYTYMTQPAISKSIRKLEEELGVELFHRTRDGIILTDKGEKLLFFVESAYNNLVTAERNMLEEDNLEKGKLAIGVPSQVGTFYLFRKIEAFHQKYPNIEITIISKSANQLLKLLETHEIDFVIDTSPVTTNIKDFIIKPILQVDNCFAVLANSKYNYDNIKSLKQLENIPLILPIPGTDNRDRLDDAFYDVQTMPKNVFNIHTSEMIISAIKKDLGAGYIIYDLIKDEVETGYLKVLPIKEELPKIEINLVYQERYLLPSSKVFIKEYLLPDFKI